jgi:hypothetical protein
MKQSLYFSIFVLAAGLFFSSCQSVEEAEKVADEFYLAYNNQDAPKMETIFDKELVMDAGITEEFYNVFDQRWQAFGKVTSHKRYAFSTNTDNGLTVVSLKYEVENETGGKDFEKLDFVKRGDAYKIFAYEYNISKSVIDNAK